MWLSSHSLSPDTVDSLLVYLQEKTIYTDSLVLEQDDGSKAQTGKLTFY